MDDFFSNGLVLAFNYLPVEVDDSVFLFWETLSLELQKKQMHLIVATTTELPDASFFTIPIHYHIADLYHQDANNIVLQNSNFIATEDILSSLSTQYHCSLSISHEIANCGIAFYSELITAIKPATIIGWQSNDIINWILRNIALQRGIPFWSMERGFLKNTLMMDIGDNYLQSELLTSLMIQNLYDKYVPEPELWEKLKSIVLDKHNLVGKYHSTAFKETVRFKAEYGIPEKSAIIAIFNHGPLGLAVKHSNSRYRAINKLKTDEVNEKINAIIKQCIKRKIYITYQEHPLSLYDNTGIKLPNSPYIIKTEENIHTLLNAADYYLFTQSTIQYEAAFYQKPMGLLSRSVLGIHGGVYESDCYDDIDEFLNALITDKDYELHQQRSKKWLSFIYHYFLIKNDDENRGSESQRVSNLLARYGLPVNIEIIYSLEKFIARWCNH
ncbi:TPA: hypothetical protein I4E15_23995 [Enterobacter asburiae]|uniref:hypothetical protein n=1 Tax=Enterobacter asburiae TaxID=61645 RepID=UPI001BCFFA9B|nr:hypothetical protein [Enterobacter asburiae]HAS1952919.1 hypothetical protein [Enterobacter asburiae]HAS1957765.1 hypothetical protein [Enterobacter asburiae]HAS1967541.1 hypothetical protein [Enterobacter asburiae]